MNVRADSKRPDQPGHSASMDATRSASGHPSRLMTLIRPPPSSIASLTCVGSSTCSSRSPSSRSERLSSCALSCSSSITPSLIRGEGLAFDDATESWPAQRCHRRGPMQHNGRESCGRSRHEWRLASHDPADVGADGNDDVERRILRKGSSAGNPDAQDAEREQKHGACAQLKGCRIAVVRADELAKYLHAGRAAESRCRINRIPSDRARALR